MFERKSRRLTIKLIALMTTGLILIATSSSAWAQMKYEDAFYYVKRQSMFMMVGFFMMLGQYNIEVPIPTLIVLPIGFFVDYQSF